ncbi:Nse4 C-terminal-domain-containing protein [Thamnocephalis sphaerospora]|uniref:Non-structural maintenance of chromosomes element 4 n=1 Tax=Thamnocephalis sphaerospora TaxID=78915 RepID=A0A4P9XW47_9FUNG|nr:Nse4 C-terminal-domain-containing protein [Thamnocephalis sphaerospora]|eukprot:RKP10524.1 Nse4 C-terminal-domain-containing protein [Thamnocephalis sphaerospora]
MDPRAEAAFSQQQDRITNREVYDPEQPEEEKRFLRQEYRRLIQQTELEHRAELQRPDSEGVLRNLKRAGELIGQVKQTYEASLDSRLLVLSADINHEKARKMRVEHGAFDSEDYVARLVTVMGGRQAAETAQGAAESLQQMDWARLGRTAGAYMRCVPAADFILGPISLEQRSRNVTRTGQRNVDRSAAASRPVELTGDEVQRQENETTKNVMAIAVLLEKVGPINLFEFIINPHSFGETVENLFHLSFLIRDGKATIDDESGEPMLACCLPPTSDDYQRGLTKKQLVLELDPPTWKVGCIMHGDASMRWCLPLAARS